MADFNLPTSSKSCSEGGMLQQLLDVLAGPSLVVLVAIVQIVWLFVLGRAAYSLFEG